jgi:streptomycin 6-kinase
MQVAPGDASDDSDEGVRAWLATLSGVIPELVERWELELGAPLEGGSVGYVLEGTRAGAEPIVLKLTYPDGWFPERVAALLRWDGEGAVELIDHDPRGAMLLERAVPGTPLPDVVDGDAALEIAASVLSRLWVPAPDGITPAVEEAGRWVATFRDRSDALGRPLSDRHLDEAEALMRELEASPGEPVLLHGDLRLRNVVAAEREPWLAISPHPLTGDREFDLATLLLDRARDGSGSPSERRTNELGRWFDITTELVACDRDRFHAWTLVVSTDEALPTAREGTRGLASAAVGFAEAIRSFTP